MAVAGPNGAGKTTLMLLMAGMLPLWRGAMYLAGNDVSALGAEERIRVGVALCPEGRRIFATLTVEENLRLGATTLRRSFDRSGVRRAINDGFEQVYSMFPILGERRQGPGGALSGGQQQMLAIGRALMSRPSVLLLDEPSLGLAPLIVDEVYEHLEKLKQSGLTIVVVEESAEPGHELCGHCACSEKRSGDPAGRCKGGFRTPRSRQSIRGRHRRMMVASLQVIVDGLSIGSTYALLALGLSLVFSVMGFVNFAYGSLIVWAGYAIAVTDSLGTPYPLTIMIMVVFAVVLSVAMGRFAFRPFITAPPATLLLTSFGVALALQAVAIFVFGEAPLHVPTPPVLIESVSVSGVRISLLQILALGLSAIVLVALNLLIQRTTFGIEIRAAAEDSEAAQLMGVRPPRVLLVVFAISGVLAAVVAFIWFARIGTVDPRADLTPTLKAFIAVVLGGLGTIRGPVIGGLVLGLFESVLATFLTTDLLAFQSAFAFGLVILVLVLRPQGVAGRLVELAK